MDHDFVKRFARLEETVRDFLTHRKGHTETKTYIVGGDIAAGLFIPEFYVGIDYDGYTPEWKQLVAFRGHVSDGEVTLDWYLNGTPIASGHVLTTIPNENEYVLDPPVEVTDADIIRPVVAGDGTGSNMSASAVLVTAGI